MLYTPVLIQKFVSGKYSKMIQQGLKDKSGVGMINI